MSAVKERFLVDEAGNRVAVVVSLEDWMGSSLVITHFDHGAKLQLDPKPSESCPLQAV
jgi:hypothetical protein